MNKKVIWIVIVIVAIVAIAAINHSKSNKAALNYDQPFKIGIIIPISGPAAALGELTKKSVDLALSKLTDEQKSKIAIVYGDDQFDPKQTVSVTQKLIETDKVNALIVYSSPSSVAASFIAEKSSIPMIGLGNSTEINTGKQWVIRYMLGPQAQAKAIESLLLKGKYQKIALIWNQSDGPKSVHDELVKILPQEGYTVVADESVTKGENDFKTSISKLRAAKPGVIMAYISPQIGIFAKQAKDLGLNIPLVSGPVFDMVDQIKAAQGGMDNQLFVSNDNVSFLNDYYAKYGTYPTIAGDYTYDALMQLIQASSQSDKSNSAIMKFLRQSFSGVCGQFTYNGDGSFDVKQVVKKWDGNKFEVVK